MNKERKDNNMATTIRLSTFNGIYFRQVLGEQRLGSKGYPDISRNILPLSALRSYNSVGNPQQYKSNAPYTRKSKVYGRVEKW